MNTKRTTLITGASAGIGKEIAYKLLAEGYTVYAAARRLENMRDLEAKGAIALKMDITREKDVVSVVKRIAGDTDGVDVLINNAGFGLYGAIEDTTIDDARYQFEVNLFGLARLTQLVLPHMREQRAGTIVNISSVGGKIYTPLGAWYYATKHALEGWSDCLRIEVAPFDIAVIIIEPGLIKTEFGDVLAAPLLKRSQNSAYSSMVQKMEAARASFATRGSSPPSVIADAVSRALQATRPRTRYVVGKFAKPMIAIRRWFGDRAFDKAVSAMIR